ncbi:sodium:proton antiporter [Thiotrichales bacterium 19X7-9]|nr:sodium:proton antiporter [Thiotrichales bacterium 19X7-9]
MDISLSLMLILILAIFCQWLSWRIRLPAILFLLAVGILLGPIAGYLIPNLPKGILDPEYLFGDDFLHAAVGIGVAIILFEGTMTLKFKEIGKQNRRTVALLITFGYIVTAILTTYLAHELLNFPWSIAALLGAIASVSGPTVVVPILRSVRPTQKLSDVIRWEGMLVDPIGAVGAVIVYSTVSHWQNNGIINAFIFILIIAVVASAIGIIFGFVIGVALRRSWVPDYLSNLFVLAAIVTAFVLSEHLIEGSGLWTVSVMGLIVGNMRSTHIEEVLNFKEHLSVLLISILFIILGANLSFDNLELVILPTLVLLLALQFIVRPLVVLFCTIKSSLNWRERILLGWIYPRGIVVASVAALFSIKVAQEMHEPVFGHQLALVTFLIIIGTVTFQSLTAPFFARYIGASAPDPRGFLIIGANKLARDIGKVLQKQGIYVLLADNTWREVNKARLEGLPCYYGNPASEHANWHINLIGIGRMLGLSHLNQVNTLSAVKFRQELGRDTIFMLPSADDDKTTMSLIDKHYSKRLFSKDFNFDQFAQWFNQGGIIKTTLITNEFSWQDYQKQYHNRLVPLFVVTPKEKFHVFSPESVINNEGNWQAPAGWKIISFILPEHISMEADKA